MEAILIIRTQSMIFLREFIARCLPKSCRFVDFLLVYDLKLLLIKGSQLLVQDTRSRNFTN